MTIQDKRLTPLQTKEFFSGRWEGEGEIAPSPLLRWLYPKEKIRYFSEAEWLTDGSRRFWGGKRPRPKVRREPDSRRAGRA